MVILLQTHFDVRAQKNVSWMKERNPQIVGLRLPVRWTNYPAGKQVRIYCYLDTFVTTAFGKSCVDRKLTHDLPVPQYKVLLYRLAAILMSNYAPHSKPQFWGVTVGGPRGQGGANRNVVFEGMPNLHSCSSSIRTKGLSTTV